MTQLDKDFFDAFLQELNVLKLDLNDVHGQSYYNGSNMKEGKIKECKENF